MLIQIRRRLPSAEGNGLRGCCVLEPPAVARPLQTEGMRTPGKPRRAGQTRTRAKFNRDESGRKLRGSDRGSVAARQRRGG